MLELKEAWPKSAISETCYCAHNILEFVDILPNVSQEVKRNVIITNENGKYELTDELRKDVNLKKF